MHDKRLSICRGVKYCGLSSECPHSTPHVVRRCPDCGTWCDESNILCHDGLCTDNLEIYFRVVNICGRPRCNVEVTKTEEQLESPG